MIKKLTRHGNSLALILDKAVLDLLNIDADTPLEVKTDGKVLTVSPVSGQADAAFDRALERVNQEFAPALKRLAE